MDRGFSMRLSPATLALALALCGCALGPQVRQAAVPAPSAAGYPMEPAAGRENGKDEDDEDESGGREREALISAEYNLRMEADENGPPTVEKILRAQQQRKALTRAPLAREKLAGVQPSQWQALGPSNVGGRVRALAFHPRNASRILAGTASGGLWVSAD